MATLTDPDVVREMLEDLADRHSSIWSRIYAYESTGTGCVQYAAFMDPRWDDMHRSPYVLSPTMLMHHQRLTPHGENILRKLKMGLEITVQDLRQNPRRR